MNQDGMHSNRPTLTHIGMPSEALRAAPRVQRHVDGPLLTWAGHLHWLTLKERFQLRLGLITIEAIAQHYWPQRREYVR
jgi:hypothetical protein